MRVFVFVFLLPTAFVFLPRLSIILHFPLFSGEGTFWLTSLNPFRSCFFCLSYHDLILPSYVHLAHGYVLPFAIGLLFSFDSLIIMCPGVTLLELILFELVELLGCVDWRFYFLSNLRSFWPLCLQILILFFSSLFCSLSLFSL